MCNGWLNTPWNIWRVVARVPSSCILQASWRSASLPDNPLVTLILTSTLWHWHSRRYTSIGKRVLINATPDESPIKYFKSPAGMITNSPTHVLSDATYMLRSSGSSAQAVMIRSRWSARRTSVPKQPARKAKTPRRLPTKVARWTRTRTQSRRARDHNRSRLR